MTITAAQFRQNFPEFSNPATYPDATVNFWLTVAGKLLNPNRWCDLIDEGTQLFVAHQMVMAAKNSKSPGGLVAPVTGKSVDKVSVNFDTTSIRIEDAGHWNGTSYGLQFYQLVRMVGMGGVQI